MAQLRKTEVRLRLDPEVVGRVPARHRRASQLEVVAARASSLSVIERSPKEYVRLKKRSTQKAARPTESLRSRSLVPVLGLCRLVLPQLTISSSVVVVAVARTTAVVEAQVE